MIVGLFVCCAIGFDWSPIDDVGQQRDDGANQHRYVRDIDELSKLRTQFPWPEVTSPGNEPTWAPETMNWHAFTLFPTGVADERINVNFASSWWQDPHGWLSYTIYENGEAKKVWLARLESMPATGPGSLDDGLPLGTLQAWLVLHEIRVVRPVNPDAAKIIEEVHGYAIYGALAKAPFAMYGYISEGGLEWFDPADDVDLNPGYYAGFTLPISMMEIEQIKKLNPIGATAINLAANRHCCCATGFDQEVQQADSCPEELLTDVMAGFSRWFEQPDSKILATLFEDCWKLHKYSNKAIYDSYMNLLKKNPTINITFTPNQFALTVLSHILYDTTLVDPDGHSAVLLTPLDLVFPLQDGIRVLDRQFFRNQYRGNTYEFEYWWLELDETFRKRTKQNVEKTFNIELKCCGCLRRIPT